MPAAFADWSIPIDQLNPEGRKLYEFSTAEAKKLLAEAGHPNGFKTTVEAPSVVYGPDFDDSVAITVKNWKAAGIDADLKLKEYGAFISSTIFGKFDNMFLGLRGAWADPEAYFYRWFMPGQPLNVWGVNDPKLTDMIKLQRRTFDVAKRKQVVFDIQRYLADQALFGVGRLDQDPVGVGRAHQELRAQQRLRLRRAAHGGLDRQVEEGRGAQRPSMRVYILRRLLVAVPSLLIASLIVFTLPRLIPGDVVQLMLEEKAYGKDLEDLRAKLGLNRPIYVQYFDWLGSVVRGQLGESLWTRQPVVLSELTRRLPVTLTLGIMATIVAIAIGMPIGVLAATRQDGALDFFARSAAILGLSIPGFVLAILVTLLPAIWWGWTPPRFVDVREGPRRSPRAVRPARDHSRRRLRRRHHATHAGDAARGPAPGLRAHGVPPRACASAWWCSSTR